eukprot:TRINITY_DN21935_c0_g1_i1.p1 TRINITY_DN21935_c0_g1~~TRINITY_DN21935_c0_g1_i1.p1  ORF type:complete len:501 (+),score=82.68 TRINITY_DN21935_c0_g1_i1:115-1503(+)
MESVLKFKLAARLLKVKGAFNFRKAWRGYERAESYLQIYMDRMKEMSSTDEHDTHVVQYEFLKCSVQFGVGLFHFIISIIPRQFLWIAEAIGFKSDRRKAFDELKSSSENSVGVRSLLARVLFVSLKAFFLNMKEEARKEFSGLIGEYPEVNLIKYIGAYLHRWEGELKESTQLLRAARKESELEQFKLYMTYEIAYNHYLGLSFDKARRLFERFLKNTQTIELKALSHYYCGVCCALSFREEEALMHMKSTPKFVRKGYSREMVCERQAKRYTSRNKLQGYSAYEHKYVKAWIKFEIKKFDEAIDLLDEASKAAVSTDEKASCQYLRGHALCELKKLDEAEDALFAVLEMEKSVSKGEASIPWTYEVLAEVQLHRAGLHGAKLTKLVKGKEMDQSKRDRLIAKYKKKMEDRWNVAREYWKKTEKFKNFDFENWLAIKIQDGLNRIENAKCPCKPCVEFRGW